MKKTALPIGFYSGGDWKAHCQVVKSSVPAAEKFESCEDAVFWDHIGGGALLKRLVVVSCDPGRRSWNTVMGPLRDPEPRGGLWLYTPSDSDSEVPSLPQPIIFTGYPDGHDFHPLGLEITPSQDGGSSSLFVVNHARQRSYIEQFLLNPSNTTVATWVRTITSEYLVAPNGIAITSPTSFYVSNDHLMTRRLPAPLGSVLPILETVLGLPTSWISHFTLLESPHGQPTFVADHSFAALGIAFANGIALSPDGRTLAVSSSSMMQVHLYDRDPTTNTLTFANTVHVPFAPDNLSFDDKGTLFAAGHPHFPSVIAIAKGHAGAVAPSWVVSISRRADAQSGAAQDLKEYDIHAPISASAKVPAVSSHVVETVFQSNGSMFGTSTTGLRDSKSGVHYIVGLYDQGMLVCKP
ncbi:hypothetical protein HWV62_31135 [Athelia sp. TMB]|nr:hypothetical protein HWV62_31135 [Athelia sp. TMB]